MMLTDIFEIRTLAPDGHLTPAFAPPCISEIA